MPGRSDGAAANGDDPPVRFTVSHVSLLAFAAALVASWVTLNVQLTNAQNAANDAQKDARTLTDRVDRLDARLLAVETGAVKQQSALTEVETQFRAADQVRNLMHLSDLRYIALLWDRSFPKVPFPSGVAYFPTLSGEPSK